ncbi:MAG: exodeoxyribonuclease VII large subunit [Bacteroidales bacterium]|jgi:exodeoxyribonuclease VII large subunit|nr:exodeoxyribonuclease VII large subunit [Bacteroidales bacterium]
MESYSLSAFNRFVRQTLEQTLPGMYWIVAEINEISINKGHCYMELIEKDTSGEQIVAKARANIWAYHFRMLHPYFKTMTGHELSAGLKVMLQVNVTFHELYGFSLQVTDLNPSFTVGELALQKQGILQQLEAEGVIDMNRGLEMEEVPLKIAVISSPTAAGYGDFSDQLRNNPAGYAFRPVLFPSVMQGNEAENSVAEALEKIFACGEVFDVVVIIRGGGSQSDLNCFNSYRIVASIAQFPVPVITGIGHERDETLADKVAHTALKTPTAVAEYLIDRVAAFDDSLWELSQQLVETVEILLPSAAEHVREQSHQLHRILQTAIHRQDKWMMKYAFRFNLTSMEWLLHKQTEAQYQRTALRSAVQNALSARRNALAESELHVGNTLRPILNIEKMQIERTEDKLRLLNPEHLMERGYSITCSGGRIVRSIHELTEGQTIETRFRDGSVGSVVRSVSPETK